MNTKTASTTEINTTSPTGKISVVGTQLLDKYVLPKVAMTLILISSAAGTWLALRGFGPARLDLVLAKWTLFIALSTVLGGSLWGALYAKTHYEELNIKTPPQFLRLEFVRFARIQWYAMLAALLGGSYALVNYSILFGQSYAPEYYWLVVFEAASWLGLISLAAVIRLRATGRTVIDGLQPWLGPMVLLSLLSLLGMAALDVVPFQGVDGLAVLARWVHLVAFGAWFGGAVWNVFVAVPAARKSLSFETIFGAASQLEQFRKVVRIALPLVVASGLYQAYRLIGLQPAALLGSSAGVVILAKLGLIIALVGIFLACPMWRACSPIAGVCDITDIDPTPRPNEKEKVEVA